MISVEKPGTPAEILEHVGVKGMRWGVRKAADTSSSRSSSTKTKSSQRVGVKNEYLRSVQSRAAMQRRVGAGKGSTSDRLKIGLTTSGLTVGRAAKRGVSPATERAIRSEEHIARMRNGKATTHDILRMTGSITMKDIVRGLEKEK